MALKIAKVGRRTLAGKAADNKGCTEADKAACTGDCKDVGVGGHNEVETLDPLACS